jgi:hypothetical protein
VYPGEAWPAGRALDGVMNRLKKLIPKLEGVRRCWHGLRYSLNVNRFIPDGVISALS